MDDETPGVPEWVVTYGDMMSLLLTFFIMLVSLSAVVADQRYRAILDALQQYVGYATTAQAPPGSHFPLNSPIGGLETLGSYTNEEDGRGGIKSKGATGEDFRALRTPEGSPLLMRDVVEFDRDSVVLSAAAKRGLTGIADELAGKPNKIEIRSHASPEKMPDGGTPDKLELTYRRARTVVDFLAASGISRDRFRLTAVGDVEPLPATGDKTALQHDRVEVLMLDTFADEYVGPRPVSDQEAE